MWIYQNKTFLDPTGYAGFVYCITNTVTGKKYIGKKIFNFTTKKKLKSKVRKIKVVKESDWKEYYGSSNSLDADIKKYGKENFQREILYLCINKSQMGYLELREQIDRRVLESDDYYNEQIRVRIHKNESLKGIPAIL